MDNDGLRERLDAAIQDVWRAPDEDPQMVTKWVLAAEWVDHEGERWLTTQRSPDTRSWDAKGMLHTILDDLAAADVRQELEAD